VILRLKGSRRHVIDREVIQLIDSVLQRKATASATESIAASNRERFKFHKALDRAIRAYGLSYGTSYFSSLSSYGSYALTRLSNIIVSALERGYDMIPSLERLKVKLENEDRQKRRSVMQIRSAASLSRLGPMLFFPIFAGITTNIVKFASLSTQSSGLLQIVPALSFYIVAANVAGFEYSGLSNPEFMERASVAAAAGLFIFRASSLVSAIMLR
jgi:hypothetical protein